MAKVLAKIGRIKCHCCGSLVVLKKQANGNPIYTCQECDFKAQAFSSDAGGRLISQCVDRFGDAANDSQDKPEQKPAEGQKTEPVKPAQPPKRASLGAALAAAFE
jgi:DNA-directed RNA polymerase subunit M/transcription elongation factor TFIIS